MTARLHQVISLIGLIIIIAVALYLASFWQSSSPDISDLTNIHGIAYPTQNGHTIVTEKLAHADIYLKGSIFAKQAVVTITFTPNQSQFIDLGIRENEFWLSYPWHRIYAHVPDRDPTEPITRTIIIPLTDKLPDHDGSLDFMIATTNQNAEAGEYEGVTDSTNWSLHDINIEVTPTLPTAPQVKNIMRQLITGTRPT